MMKKDTQDTEGYVWVNPRRLSGTWVQDRGNKVRGKWTSNNNRCRHAAWGTETSGRGWRESGVDNFQVDSVPRWERRWGAGET